MRKVWRAIKVAGVLAVVIALVGARTSATERVAGYDKTRAKLLADIQGKYILGAGATDDCKTNIGTDAATPQRVPIVPPAFRSAAARLARTAPTVAGAGEQCGEYSCQYDWGTGMNVCFINCDWVNMAGSIYVHCCCWDGGDCGWGVC